MCFLLGNTGVGKSTLANSFIRGSQAIEKDDFGHLIVKENLMY